MKETSYLVQAFCQVELLCLEERILVLEVSLERAKNVCLEFLAFRATCDLFYLQLAFQVRIELVPEGLEV